MISWASHGRKKMKERKEKRVIYLVKDGRIERKKVLSSLLELPTITVPVGFNKNKLPMGMQIIGKKKDDLKVLAFARKYEQMFNYSKIKPEI